MSYNVKPLCQLMELHYFPTNCTLHLRQDATSGITLPDSVIISNFNHRPQTQHRRSSTTCQGSATTTSKQKHYTNFSILTKPNDVKLLWHTNTGSDCVFHLAKTTSATNSVDVGCDFSNDNIKSAPHQASGGNFIDRVPP